MIYVVIAVFEPDRELTPVELEILADRIRLEFSDPQNDIAEDADWEAKQYTVEIR